MPTTTDLSIATYNFRDPEERARFNEQELRRIQETVIPPAMLPDSGADVGG